MQRIYHLTYIIKQYIYRSEMGNRVKVNSGRAKTTDYFYFKLFYNDINHQLWKQLTQHI